MKEISLAEITLSKNNPRRRFDKQKLVELTESIKQKGVIEPIIVRTVDGKYEVVCGERRLTACKNAGLETIPAIVRELTDEQALEFQIIENLQREDLNAIDEAHGFKSMLEKCHYTQEDLSSKTGKSQSYIANRIRLLSLPKDVQDSISREIITPGHGIVLLRLDDPKEQRQLYKNIVEEKLSIKRAENELDRYGRSLSTAPFDKKDCIKCPFNGDKQMDLFDKDTKLKGRCLNAMCFAKKVNEYVTKKIGELRKKGFNVSTEAKLLRKLGVDRVNHVTFDPEYSYYGNPRKKLGNKYKERCSKCKNRHFIIGKEGDYGENKGLRRIEEWCLNERCYNALTRSKDATNPEDPKNQKERLKMRSEFQALEAKQRFWKGKIKSVNTRAIIDTINLYMLITNSRLDRLLDNVLPKKILGKTEWGGYHVEMQSLYSLSDKERSGLFAEISKKAFDGYFIDDEDLAFLCAKVGFQVEKDFVIDRAFLQPKVKEQLIALAKEIGLVKYLKMKKICEPKKLMEKKKGELIDFFLKKGFELKGKIPKEIKTKQSWPKHWHAH